MAAGKLKSSGTSGKMLKDTTTGKLKRCDCCAGQCVCCHASNDYDCCVPPSNPPCGGGGGQPACQLVYELDWTIDGSLSATNGVGCPGTSDTFSESGTASGSGGSCTGGIAHAVVSQFASSTQPSYGFSLGVVPQPGSGTLCNGGYCTGVTLYETCAGSTRASAFASLSVGNNSASGGLGCAIRDRCTTLGMNACIDHNDDVDLAINLWNIVGGTDTLGCYDDDLANIDSDMTATATFVREGCIVKSVELTMSGTATLNSELYPGSPLCAPLVVTVDVTATGEFPDISGIDCAASYGGEVLDPDE